MEPNESIWPESNKIVESKTIIVMSGMSIKPGGGGVAPRPISNDSDYCLNLKIKTNLSSVKMDVLAKSKVGDVLPVVAEGLNGPVHVMKDGEMLGTILSGMLLELLNCMNGGTEYEATIEKIDEAICQVTISAVK